MKVKLKKRVHGGFGVAGKASEEIVYRKNLRFDPPLFTLSRRWRRTRTRTRSHC